MPTYVYECSTCEHKLEKQQRFADAPLKQCPVCLTDTLERVISGGIGFFDSTPKTLGSLAEQNSRLNPYSNDKANEKAKTTRRAADEELWPKLKTLPKDVEGYIENG